jgi:Glycosyl transferase family 90
MQFMRDRLRIRDVRLYIRDLLSEYASLQKFKPKPNPLARCLDWERMLMEFEWPHYKEVSAHAAVQHVVWDHACCLVVWYPHTSHMHAWSEEAHCMLAAHGAAVAGSFESGL